MSVNPNRRAGEYRGLRRVIGTLVCLPLALLPLACDTTDTSSLAQRYLPRNAHQAYGHSLAQSRLTQTALGRDWIAAAESALLRPTEIELPFTVEAAIAVHEPRALGYRFSLRAGHGLRVVVDLVSPQPRELFVDLFEVTPEGTAHVATAPAAPSVAASVGSSATEQVLEWPVAEDTDFVLRIQPELLRGGALTVSIGSSALLGFPVTGLNKRAILSGFGAERDGGRRAHRGVDIFADRGTNAIAASDGWVTRVETTPRGGNVVWVASLFGDMRLYYAHLDAQLVEEGQFVQTGDLIGKVGNTGNARTTPPHLHFGVYMRRRGMRGGARDPYDYLQ